MATANVPDGDTLPLERSEYTWADELVGTKEQIQAAGIGVGVAFPGEPGAQPRQITVLDPRGYKARIARAFKWLGAGRYRVEIKLPEAERERRREAWAVQDKLRVTREKADAAGMRVEEWALRGVPESIDEYRANTLGWVEGSLEMIGSRCAGRYGYSFDAASLSRLAALAAGIKAVVEQGRIAFNAAEHEQAVAEKLAEAGIVRAPERPKRPALRVVQ